MAAQNEQIGIAVGYLLSALTLSAGAGLQGTSLLNLFSWPARVYSAGATASETLYDAGKRRAQIRFEQDRFRRDGSSVPPSRVSTRFNRWRTTCPPCGFYEKEAIAVNEAVKAARRFRARFPPRNTRPEPRLPASDHLTNLRFAK